MTNWNDILKISTSDAISDAKRYANPEDLKSLIEVEIDTAIQNLINSLRAMPRLWENDVAMQTLQRLKDVQTKDYRAKRRELSRLFDNWGAE